MKRNLIVSVLLVIFTASVLLSILIISLTRLGTGYLRQEFGVAMPSYPEVKKAIWLDQGWSPEQRARYHYLSQGTITFGIPYEWFVALERPELSLVDVGLLSDPSYLDRFGFIPPDPGSEDTVLLPVGFARGGPMVSPSTGERWLDPQTGKDTTAIGLTCAACHTGRLTYKGTEFYVDGAGALADIPRLNAALAVSLLYTKYVPFRFDRFAKRLLGENASEDTKAQTRAKLDSVVAEVKRLQQIEASFGAANRIEGFSRLGALSRGGNQLFGDDLNNIANQVAISDPVHYPHIWWSSWFEWVQYDSSLEQPMVRNVLEALGVGATVNLVGKDLPLFASTIDVTAIFELETLLAGGQPKLGERYTGLRAPKWPEDILPPIDHDLAGKGAPLYKELCEGCHLPPVGTAEFFNGPFWKESDLKPGARYLALNTYGLGEIGTDPARAEIMAKRKVAVPKELGIETDDFALALGELLEKTVNRWYDSQTPPTPQATRDEMNGYRQSGARHPLAYKARPLDGIWATAPYLHNGSVPNLYALLSPVAERPVYFILGQREFDPEKVGLHHDSFDGGTLIDTGLRGNWNIGHEFDDAPGRAGVVGRKLSVSERRALVEYLKTF